MQIGFKFYEGRGGSKGSVIRKMNLVGFFFFLLDFSKAVGLRTYLFSEVIAKTCS